MWLLSSVLMKSSNWNPSLSLYLMKICHQIACNLEKKHYRWMEGRHIGSQHRSKFAQSILMPRIVFHRDFGLNFAIINNDRTKFWKKNQIQYFCFPRNHHCITRNTTFSQIFFLFVLKIVDFRFRFVSARSQKAISQKSAGKKFVKSLTVNYFSHFPNFHWTVRTFQKHIV